MKVVTSEGPYWQVLDAATDQMVTIVGGPVAYCGLRGHTHPLTETDIGWLCPDCPDRRFEVRALPGIRSVEIVLGLP